MRVDGHKNRSSGRCLVAAGIFLVLHVGCASTDGGKKTAASKQSLKSESKADSAPQKKRPADGRNFSAASRTLFASSLSNNRFTSGAIDKKKADAKVNDYSAQSKSKNALESRLSAQRLAGKSISSVLSTGKRLADMEMARAGVKGELSDEVKLELAIAAVGNRKFALADYYLTNLYKSRVPRVRAGAFNLAGVVDLRNGRIPQAVVKFRQALKAVGSYRPALINLGFTALRGGDAKAAGRSLSSLQEDWFVQTGLVSISRINGDAGRVDSLCNRLADRKHKPTLYNCGLHEFQTKKNFTKAKTLMTNAAKLPGGSQWEEKIYQTLGAVTVAERAAKKNGAAAKPGKGAK